MSKKKTRKIPLYMIGVIHDNLEELSKVMDLETIKNGAKEYYDLNDFQWELATSFADDIFNLLIWLYESAYWWDDTVFEYSTSLYNKYFPNKPKYPHQDNRKSTFVELKEDYDGAF